ncbi:FkbM family methyltransferase [Neotabrizicola sp. VNH66]|uniref:FkbM family methyltransferase n=1 Tax=Neotabrizicola sp. VNH66 TaxID=3400918 RepID=UPI003C081541
MAEARQGQGAGSGGGTADPGLRLLLDRLAPAPRLAIADVGANPLTPPPYAGLLAAGGCTVFGFEPQAEAFAALPQTETERYLPVAVGDGSEIALNIYASSGMTSVFRPDLAAMDWLGKRKRWGTVLRTVQVPTVRLDDVAGLEAIDLLKIDIQGGERAVIENGPRLLSGASAVITELRYYPLYEGEPMLHGVDAVLRAQGFVLHRFLPMSARALPNSQSSRLNLPRMRDQLVDGDAVYIRDPARGLTDRQLVALALLAAGVFGSHTLVLNCLDRLVQRGLAPAELPSAYVDLLPARLRSEGGT